MTREEALKMIKSENLQNFNWFSMRNSYPNEVGIIIKDNTWIVYSTDERASIRNQVKFQSESDALTEFIERLRADKILRSL
ncbi:Imm59 family immunity protein [Fredinandcohnia sp. QZ13]|uniref:Imm59 family immunity protein n=1 Tax=Fredinandcohnia sp. QZ13 TaxID=3073144 RepID=UPI002852F6DA|nr:Imm59 family immunity protein [Fredinandcohnia sp. QZ13]MDR4887684.1 Imm59 family immunity protein [Fredinandcohnia sp. QZ13]